MSQTTELQRPGFEPATILVTASPAVGKETEWEQALGELIRASMTFPGHLGTTVLKPANATDRDYRIITKFDSSANMDRWSRSAERRRRVDRLTAYEAAPADIHYVTGLETWFELPRAATAPAGTTAPSAPPPKYKMAAIIWIAVYFTVLPMIAVLKPYMADLPGWLGNAVLAVISVALMTWIVMPALTWAFRCWLFPRT